MTEPSMDEVLEELGRLGLTLDDVPTLALPASVSMSDFLRRLQELPDAAGMDGFEAVMDSLPWPARPEWDQWPDPGDVFSSSDYIEAFGLINAAPKIMAEPFLRPPRDVPTWLLALMSEVSPDLEARVDEFRGRVRAERVSRGRHSAATEANVQFNTVKHKLAESLGPREARPRYGWQTNRE